MLHYVQCFRRTLLIASLASLTVLCSSVLVSAQKLTASDGALGFGNSVSLAGDLALVGAVFDNGNGSASGSAYYFKGVDANISGTATEDVKLTASDAAQGERFGQSVSLSGDSALVGAFLDNENGANSGSAYYFKGLDSNTSGAATENVKLTASDGAVSDNFGQSVSLSGDSALVGAAFDDDSGSGSGSAYYFRDLDTNSSGAATENVKLTASDGSANDLFGRSVSLSGDSALIGAVGDDNGAYYFRDLDSNTSGVATESVKLTASDGAVNDQFGSSVSLSGDSALVGAAFDDDNGSGSGSAYYFKVLDANTSGAATENVKLTASDGAASDQFGIALSLSGDSALVGADRDDDNGENSGSAYYFRELDANASGSATETLKLTASDGSVADLFGISVSLSGDSALVGAFDTGAAYRARISNMTTVDEGNTVRHHAGINFESRTDWIIGETTDNNSLTLSAGTMAVVDGAGQSILIGAMAGSNDNSLTVEGMIEGMDLFIGSMAGNMGNQLVMTASGVLDVDNLHLAAGNRLLIEGDVSDFGDLLSYLSSTMRPTDLFADDMMGGWQLIDSSNASSFLLSSFDSSTGFTTITTIPEPGTATLLGLVALVAIGRRCSNDSR